MLENLPQLKRLHEAREQDRLDRGVLISGPTLESVEAVCLDISAKLLNAPDPRKHPDFHELRPQKRARMIGIGTDSERVAGRWPPNSMRRLVADLSLTSNARGAKVAVIYEADRMNNQASNAFLKTLEEPPSQTTLFLLTTNPYQLLPTIRSRCIFVRLPDSSAPDPDPVWMNWLESYGDWLQTSATVRMDKATGNTLIFKAYGLMTRFEAILDAMADDLWNAEKEKLPEGLDEDAVSAHEVGIRKGHRAGMFRDIEAATLAFARIEPESHATKATRAIDVLEQVSGLMEVNYQPIAALENFLLRSLAIWCER